MMELLPRLHKLVSEIAAESGQKVRLVGWSRGGMLSREIARDYPDLIEKVITIGSPVRGGTTASSIGKLVQQTTGITPAQMASIVELRGKTPISVPVRAIYSKTDGVVAWKACIDEDTADVEHHEVEGSHVGLGSNVQVFKLVPKLLKEPT